jgi:esterase/lipase
MRFLTYFPRWFAKRGFSSALMILPYHFDRTPDGKKSGEMFLETTDNSVLRSRFEHAVVDVLTSLDYLKDRFGYPLYLMGYSFGGMISVISAAFRSDLSGLSLVVTGGNFYHITWRSVVTRVFRVQYEKNEECDVEKCRYWHSEGNFYRYVEELESPRIPLDTAPMPCYEYDPLVFAKFVKAPTVMISALFDFFIPYESSRELFEHLGSERKVRYILPSGHVTSYLIFRSFIARKSLQFFSS